MLLSLSLSDIVGITGFSALTLLGLLLWVIKFINREVFEFKAIINNFKLNYLAHSGNKATPITSYVISAYNVSTLNTHITQIDVDRFIKELEEFDKLTKNKYFPFKNRIEDWSKGIQKHLKNTSFNQIGFKQKSIINVVQCIIENNIPNSIGIDNKSYYWKCFLYIICAYKLKMFFRNIKEYFNIFILRKYTYRRDNNNNINYLKITTTSVGSFTISVLFINIMNVILYSIILIILFIIIG